MTAGFTSLLTVGMLASGPALSAGATARPTPVLRSTTSLPAVSDTAASVARAAVAHKRISVNRILHAPARKPAGPSGVAMPKANLAHWKVRSAVDFTGTSLPSGWDSYEGQPGGEPNGLWKHSHTYVKNGVLTLAGYRDGSKFVTGGVMAYGANVGQQTYGKYEVRFRMDQGHGVKYAVLLWPKSERWPIDGEIDFAEDGGGARDASTGTLHYGASNSQIQKTLKGNFSRWNTLGVEWSPGKLVYTLNGRPWASLTGAMVPHTPMNLAIQTQAGTCGGWAGASCPNASTPSRVNMQIDWAVTYSYVR